MTTLDEMVQEVKELRTQFLVAAEEMRAKAVAAATAKALLPLRQNLTAATKARQELQNRFGGMLPPPSVEEVEKALQAESNAIEALENALRTAGGKFDLTA